MPSDGDKSASFDDKFNEAPACVKWKPSKKPTESNGCVGLLHVTSQNIVKGVSDHQHRRQGWRNLNQMKYTELFSLFFSLSLLHLLGKQPSTTARWSLLLTDFFDCREVPGVSLHLLLLCCSSSQTLLKYWGIFGLQDTCYHCINEQLWDI